MTSDYHAVFGDGEAKYWFEASVYLAKNCNFSTGLLARSHHWGHYDELTEAWKNSSDIEVSYIFS